MLAVAVVHLHHVVEGCVEEGELSKYHCGGDRCGGLSVEDHVAMGEGWEVWGTPGQEGGALSGSCWFMGSLLAEPFDWLISTLAIPQAQGRGSWEGLAGILLRGSR